MTKSPNLPSSGASDLRTTGLSAFEAEIVAVFADLVVLLGLPKSMGEIYGLVFASAEPPTFADIEQKLGLSKGSVSQGLRALKELGAVSDVGAGEGTAPRATHWKATTELRQLIGSLIRERVTPYLGRQDQRMQAAEAALDAEAGRLSSTDFKALKQRLDKLQTWQSRARTVLPVLGKML